MFMNSLWTVRAEFVFTVNVWLRHAFTLSIAWTKNVRSTALQNYPIIAAWWLICWMCLIIVWEKESVCRLKAVRDSKLTLTIPDQHYKYFKGKLVIDRWSTYGLSWAVRCHLELICLWLIILVWQPDFLLFNAFFHQENLFRSRERNFRTDWLMREHRQRKLYPAYAQSACFLGRWKQRDCMAEKSTEATEWEGSLL